MKRYRARLSNGRVVGPFPPAGIKELAEKRHIDGSEKFQEFPVGDWRPLEVFPELQLLVEEGLQKPAASEATFARKLSDIERESFHGDRESKNSDEEGSFPREFDYHTVDAEEDKPENAAETDLSEEKDAGEKTATFQTEMRSEKNGMEADPGEKTRITPDTLKWMEEQKEKEKEEERKKAEELSRVEENQEEREEIDLDNDSTQVISLSDLRQEVEPEVAESERALTLEEMKAKKREAEKARSDLPAAVGKSRPDDEEEERAETAAKKKRKIILIAAALVLGVLLLPNDKEESASKEVKIVYPQITFPRQYDIPDKEKAAKLYKKAVETASKGSYTAKIKAANLFRSSLENQFKQNPAAAKLIFGYSNLLPHSNDLLGDANRVFKLVQIFGSSASKDADLAAATALFYLNIDKGQAAVKTVEKFNTIKDSKPTLELFSVFLKALMETGELVKASAAAKKLAEVKNRPLFTDLALFDFYVFKGDYERAAKTLSATEKRHPGLTPVMLRKADLFLYKEDFKSLAGQLRKIRKAQAGHSKVYYGKYLEYLGMLAVKNNKPKSALKAFKKALSLNESLELRSRLAALSAESTGEAGQLINESKAIKLIARSKNHWKNDNVKFAFKDALEAVRIAPNYLPAELYLAGLQIKRSYFTEAIDRLEKLYDEHPRDPKVVFALVDAYIEAYKFDKTKDIMGIISGSDLRLHPDYAAKMAKFYVYKDEFSGAVAWLQKAINKNPLDDENTYELAKLFIRYRKYNQGKLLLNKAMELDPSRVDFRVSYADILYETEGADAAIGYLYDVLRDFPDNAKILSSIGIFYYRSGQIKMFRSVKEKLLKLPDKDTALFEFLIKSAKMEEKYDDVVKYSKELIEINPGDLRTRLFLGQVYMEMSKYKEALEQFNAVKERLPSYPKLQYFLSKLYLLTDNMEKAKELAEKEIEGNPSSINGYLLLGDIYKKQEKYVEAEKQYKKAQKINPSNVDVLVSLAYINFMKSQYDIALDLFKKAKNIEPGRSETHKLLGDVYRKLGQSALAIESYKMFLELSPNTRYKQNLQNYINMMR